MFPGSPITTRNVLRPIKEGDNSWVVAALQINLVELGYSVTVDGVFGETTRTAVVRHQRKHGLIADGIVGPTTSKSICLNLMWAAQRKYGTPPGLGRGVLEGESGYDVACVSDTNSNGTRDVGAWQDSTTATTDNERLRASFNARRMALETLGKFRRQRNLYVEQGCKNRVAWQLATLYHNRPADADTLARASRGSDEINWLVLSDAPGWFTIGGISYSKRAWCQKYVRDKTKYVTSWTA